MNRPRILFVSPVSDFKGGAEVVLHRMLANPHIDPVLAVPEEGPLAEAARAMQVSVCTYHPSAMLRVHRPPRPGPMLAAVADALRCARRLQHLAAMHRCAIVHSNGLKPHMLCAILGTFTRTKTLVHLHDIAYRASERAIWKTIAHRVAQVVIVSRPCYPSTVLPPHVQVVHNGIQLVCGMVPPARVAGPLRLGFVGRFHPNKGLDLLLDWFIAVRRSGIAATLTIRGRPDPDIPEYWTKISARIHAEGLDAFVRQEGWVTGPATYANLDMLLVSSQTPDPLPLVIPEAMSAGVVVAGYPAGGIVEMIEDGRTGLLVRSGEDLAGRIASLMVEPGALERMRHAGHAHVAAEFSIARFHGRMLEIYQRMLSPGQKAENGRTPRL